MTSSVKIPRLTFHRHLLEGVRSASERSRPPKMTRALGRSQAGICLRAKKGCPAAPAEVADRGVARQPTRRVRVAHAQRVRGLPTAAQSCRPSCLSLPMRRGAPAAAGGRHAPALGAANEARRWRVPSSPQWYTSRRTKPAASRSTRDELRASRALVRARNHWHGDGGEERWRWRELGWTVPQNRPAQHPDRTRAHILWLVPYRR